MDFQPQMADITKPVASVVGCRYADCWCGGELVANEQVALNLKDMKSKQKIRFIAGGVTAPKGFRAAGIEAGIKYANRRDFALLVSDTPAAAAAVFTTNQVAAAPVQLDRAHIRSGRAQAVAVNSGCANACTGRTGMQHGRAMVRATAEALGIDAKLVFICSTGVIGANLPIDRIVVGARLAAKAIRRTGGHDAARAIMTTDTVDKQVALKVKIDGRAAGIKNPRGAVAKGLGFCPEDRKVSGIVPDLSVRENIMLVLQQRRGWWRTA